MSRLSIEKLVSKLLRGLETRNINFILSENALGCNFTEVYLTEARELILFHRNQLDTVSIQWILQIRTPINTRITIFTTDVSILRTQLMNAIKKLQQEGLEITQPEDAISILGLTEANIQYLLDSLKNSTMSKSKGKPVSLNQTSSSYLKKENRDLNDQKFKNLRTHLQTAIKTYWTGRYFARYLNIPLQKVKELATRIGIQHELCGNETLYFFDRNKALRTYFAHIIKGILDEMDLKYRETSTHDFFLPDINMALRFFDGEIEQLNNQADRHTQNPNLIVIIPEALRNNVEQFQDNSLLVLPLNQDKIKSALIKVVQQRVYFIPAYSSGLIH